MPMDNPEKVQILLFPLITLALFIGAIVVLWLINHFVAPALFGG